MFSSKRVLIQHKKNCLKINGQQTMKLRSCSVKFKDHFKQLAVPFKMYVDLESLLKRVKSNNNKK